MDRTPRWIVLVLSLALAASPLGAADKDKPADPKDKPPDKKDMINAGSATGRVIHVESAGKGFVIEIQVPVPDPNAMVQIARLRQQAALARSPQERMNAMAQLARTQPFRMQPQQLELEPAEEMVVRSKNPPIAFDEKGNLKRYTQKELKELKGDDPKMPGFAADFESLKMGQFVQVTLQKKKPEGKPKAGKKEDMEFLNEDRPLVKMVMIVAEPPPQ